MSWLDFGIIGILAVSVIIGLMTGLIKAVLSLAGIVIGIILGARFSVALGAKLAFIPNQKAAEIVAFGLILVGTMLLAMLLAWVLSKITSAIMLGWANRLGGAIFGLLMGAVFCAAFLAIGVKYLGISGLLSESATAVMLLERFEQVFSLIPDKYGVLHSFFL